MKKVFFVSIILLIIIFWHFIISHGLNPNPDQYFRDLVFPQQTTSVENIKLYKDNCGMHGPWFFAFKADTLDIQKIIKYNELKEIGSLHFEFQQNGRTVAVNVKDSLLNHIYTHKLNWWPRADKFEKMSFYGKFSGEIEPYFIFLFIGKLFLAALPALPK